VAVIAGRDHLLFDQYLDHAPERVEEYANLAKFLLLGANRGVTSSGGGGRIAGADVLLHEAAILSVDAIVELPLAALFHRHASPQSPSGANVVSLPNPEDQSGANFVSLPNRLSDGLFHFGQFISSDN